MGGDWPQEPSALLRRQRHSVMNHLQVISGWLQLNRPDRASAYLEALATRLIGESEVLRRLPPALYTAAIALMLEAESLDLQIEWRIEGAICEEQLESLQRKVAQFHQRLTAVPALPGPIRITFGPGDHLAVHTSAPGGAG